jgi:uncharacterized protein
MEVHVSPVTETERISSIDTLRGFAVLGILAMNIQSFAMPGAAYMNPTAYGDLSGANFWTWLASHVLFDQKFMTIFSLLFGAGIVLLTSRVEARGGSPARIHYRRMMWLLMFGLLHAYLLWYGDILVLYALCGMLVYKCRKLSPRTLLIAGLVTIAVAFAVSLFSGWSMQFWPPEQIAKFTEENWRPGPERIARELAAYRGGWLEQMAHRVPSAFFFQVFLFFIWGLWRAGGLMLVGMGLFKLGVLSAARSRAFYARLFAAGALLGLPIVLYGVHRNFAAGWNVRFSFFFGSQYNYWGSILVSLGWLGIVLLACKAPALGLVTRPLAAVGRMAFTNYLVQTFICTTLFYGHGFGLFGSVPRIGQLGIVAAIWALQLSVSPIWLRYFHLGPFEWLWRSLTYWEPQPFRRIAAASPTAEPAG